MKTAILATSLILASMTLVFLVSCGLAYWYECGKDMCLWNYEVKNTILGFTITTGVIGGAINFVYVTNSKIND